MGPKTTSLFAYFGTQNYFLVKKFLKSGPIPQARPRPIFVQSDPPGGGDKGVHSRVPGKKTQIPTFPIKNIDQFSIQLPIEKMPCCTSFR